MLYHESHLMQDKINLFENYRHLNQRNTADGATFTCAGFSVAIMSNKPSVFLFNFLSHNDQRFHDPNGKARHLEFRSMTSLNNFLKTFFIRNVSVSAKTQYDFQYIAIKERQYHSENIDFSREKNSLYYNENAEFIREKQCSYYAKKLLSYNRTKTKLT